MCLDISLFKGNYTGKSLTFDVIILFIYFLALPFFEHVLKILLKIFKSFNFIVQLFRFKSADSTSLQERFTSDPTACSPFLLSSVSQLEEGCSSSSL